MRQKYLHKFGLVILLILLAMTVPLSTLMYTPSLPQISEDLHTSNGVASLTLVFFNVFIAIGVMLFGPLSDKYGRKKPLLITIALYIVGNFACFASQDISFLIFARALEAFGAGGMMSLMLAIVKDSYSDDKRGNIIAFLQFCTFSGPVIAPLLGSAVLTFANWRYIFIILALIAVVAFCVSLFFIDTIAEDERQTGRLLITFGRVFSVAKNKKFTMLLLVGAIYSCAFFTYIASSTFIYQQYFNLSQSEFSIYFSIAALIALVGPVLCVFLNKRFSVRGSIRLIYICGFIGSLAMIFVGGVSPVAFLLCSSLCSLGNSAIKPYTTNVLLKNQKGDAGSASSLINFTYLILGAPGMMAAGLNFADYVLCIALSMFFIFLIGFIVWIPTSKLYKYEK